MNGYLCRCVWITLKKNQYSIIGPRASPTFAHVRCAVRFHVYISEKWAHSTHNRKRHQNGMKKMQQCLNRKNNTHTNTHKTSVMKRKKCLYGRVMVETLHSIGQHCVLSVVCALTVELRTTTIGRHRQRHRYCRVYGPPHAPHFFSPNTTL